MSNIVYNEKEGTVKQHIATIGGWMLEGRDLAELPDIFEKELSRFREPAKVYDLYADGTNEKKVKFDKFFMSLGIEKYDGDPEFRITGERPITPEELDGLKRRSQT